MVWERIRQKDEEARVKAERARLEAAQRQRVEEENQLRQKREREAKAAEEERARIRHLMTLLQESRLIQHMADLKKGIIAAKKDIVFNGHSVILIWGRYHIEKETELVLSEHTLKRGNVSYSSITRVQDYLYITAGFNLKDEALVINGREIPREKWRGRQDVIVDALADAYRNPQRKQSNEKWNKERSSSSSSSSSTECCHS